MSEKPLLEQVPKKAERCGDNMKHILELIENVDPSDTAKMDEIDARVWCYVSGHEYIHHSGIDTYNFMFKHYPSNSKRTGSVYSTGRYTRSRDALKSIRPEGWCIMAQGENMPRDYYCTIEERGSGKTFVPHAPTEELAELHAIIQAISHERGQE